MNEWVNAWVNEWVNGVRCTKVSEFDIVVRVEQQVLRLQIAMHHHVRVAVLHARDDLLEEAARLVLAQLSEYQNNKSTIDDDHDDDRNEIDGKE